MPSEHQRMPVIKRDSDRNYYMSAQEALTYGMVDEILSPKEAAAAASR